MVLFNEKEAIYRLYYRFNKDETLVVAFYVSSFK